MSGTSRADSVDTATCPELSPFRDFLSNFERAGVSLSDVSVVDAARIPSPYRELLSHRRNMTPTLESHFASQARLVVLEQSEENGIVKRFILLEVDDQRPQATATVATAPRYKHVAEFSTILIHLRNIPDSLHAEIRAGSAPLGTLLIRAGVNQSVNPHFFIKVDVPVASGLGRLLRAPHLPSCCAEEAGGESASGEGEGKRACECSHAFYARTNTLRLVRSGDVAASVEVDDDVIANVVEMLPLLAGDLAALVTSGTQAGPTFASPPGALAPTP